MPHTSPFFLPSLSPFSLTSLSQFSLPHPLCPKSLLLPSPSSFSPLLFPPPSLPSSPSFFLLLFLLHSLPPSPFPFFVSLPLSPLSSSFHPSRSPLSPFTLHSSASLLSPPFLPYPSPFPPRYPRPISFSLSLFSPLPPLSASPRPSELPSNVEKLAYDNAFSWFLFFFNK